MWIPTINIYRDIDEMPRFINLEKQLGGRGFLMFYKLLSLTARKYKYLPEYPIIIFKSVVTKRLFGQRKDLEYLKNLLKIVEWEYTETETEFCFHENKDTQLFKYNKGKKERPDFDYEEDTEKFGYGRV
jgi:hypothetical protein